MKYLRFTFVFLVTALGIARAQDEDRGRRPPTEIPDFSNLDEYIYEPKSIMTLGIRHLSSAKTSFSGGGTIVSPFDNPGPATGANLLRHYHDGTLQPDARVAGRVDNSGNPVVDPSSGNQIFDRVAPDGKTNTWAYAHPSQVSDNGFLIYNSYSARITDPRMRDEATLPSSGLDLSVSRDMGNLFGSKLSWYIVAGMSVTDISADRHQYVQADITTQSDYYSLFGQTPPPPPYGSPSSKTLTLSDSAGQPILTDDGVPQTIVADNSILLANAPAARITTVVTDETSVWNRWKLKGAFYTFRLGPTIVVPVFSRVQMTFSAGPALIYSGTSYTVTHNLTPATGVDVTDTGVDIAYKLLPGYFADASLQYNITERTGFYAGALFQSAGTYDQHLNNTSAQYSTRVDFANQSGMRAGMTYRF